jgi:bile acid-coenzyme A ligase
MIISGGVNIYPAEVEAALLRHHQVASAAVIGLKDDEFGQRVHAVVERRDASLDADALTAFLREHLVLAKVPRSIEFVDGPVRDDAGKVRRSALRAVREA